MKKSPSLNADRSWVPIFPPRLTCCVEEPSLIRFSTWGERGVITFWCQETWTPLQGLSNYCRVDILHMSHRAPRNLVLYVVEWVYTRTLAGGVDHHHRLHIKELVQLACCQGIRGVDRSITEGVWDSNINTGADGFEEATPGLAGEGTGRASWGLLFFFRFSWGTTLPQLQHLRSWSKP